jgi:amino acid permease
LVRSNHWYPDGFIGQVSCPFGQIKTVLGKCLFQFKVNMLISLPSPPYPWSKIIAFLISVPSSGLIIIESRQNVIVDLLCFLFFKTIYNIYMFSGIFVKILSIVLLIAVGIVLILGIGTLFKGGETSKKYSNKLMQLRVLLQFIAVLVLVGFAYFFKN